jgi:hypothetical protein
MNLKYESCQNDIIALRVGEFKSRKILFAFGGAIFSDSTDEEIRKRFKMPWIKVALKSGRCEESNIQTKLKSVI